MSIDRRAALTYAQSVRGARWAFVFVLAIAIDGCSDDCVRDQEGFCASECLDNLDCNNLCPPGDPLCVQSHVCQNGVCQAVNSGLGEGSVTPVFPPPGWDAPFGSGAVFIINDFGVEPVSAANRLGVMSERWSTVLRQLLLAGETLWAIQIAGAPGSLEGSSGSVTISMAPVRDADDPPFPVNNFSAPPGFFECCEFKVRQQFLDENRVAIARWPAVINQGRLVSVGHATFEAEMPSFQLPVGRLEPKPFIIEQSRLQMDAISSRTISGRVTGMHPAAWLATVSLFSTVRQRPENDRFLTRLEEVFAFVGQPDVDIDGDGLECFYDLDGDFKIDECCDGDGDLTCGAICTGDRLPQSGLSEVPCAGAAGAADGYSVSYALSAVRARIVGTTD